VLGPEKEEITVVGGLSAVVNANTLEAI